MDIRSIPERSVEGVQRNGNRSSLGGWLVITHKAKSKGYFGIKDIQKSQVTILWNCGEGGSKIGRTVTSYTVMTTRHVRR
jgi:hypothetical protein